MDGVKDTVETDLVERELILEHFDGLTVGEGDLALAEENLIGEILRGEVRQDA